MLDPHLKEHQQAVEKAMENYKQAKSALDEYSRVLFNAYPQNCGEKKWTL